MSTGNRQVHIAEEKLYTVREVSQIWGISENTVRRMFRDVPGVLKVSIPRLVRKQRKHAPPVLLSIPESILHRAHQDWSGGFRGEV
jgi:AraC-like DNA-binding protein